MNTFESFVFATSVSLLVVVFCNVLSAVTRPKKENRNVANFRAYSGLYVKIEDNVTIEDEDGNIKTQLKQGEILQILSNRWAISFVGVNGSFPNHKVPMTPMYDYDPRKKS